MGDKEDLGENENLPIVPSKDESLPDLSANKKGKMGRAALSIVGGAIPFAGGLFSAAAGHWSDKDQEEVNDLLKHWIDMLKEELAEKERTIIEVMARLDMQDAKIKERIKSNEYQSLVKKTFRDWSAGESEDKRLFIRNILTNAAASDISSDDVVRMFLDWLKYYTEMHFEVIASIYNSNGITRAGIWNKIGRGHVREDSAEADLFKLLIRDLSTGGVIRQHREKDYQGNFIKKKAVRSARSSGSSTTKSAFADDEGYELTALGEAFVHYAMNELPIKIAYEPEV